MGDTATDNVRTHVSRTRWNKCMEHLRDYWETRTVALGIEKQERCHSRAPR
jgi:hypothetical protein